MGLGGLRDAEHAQYGLHAWHGGWIYAELLAGLGHADDARPANADARHSLAALHAAGSDAVGPRRDDDVSADRRLTSELQSLHAATAAILYAELLQPLPGLVATGALLLVWQRSLRNALS